jgi:hypothetical protein
VALKERVVYFYDGCRSKDRVVLGTNSGLLRRWDCCSVSWQVQATTRMDETGTETKFLINREA